MEVFMQITGSYQGYTKQQNLAALQNFLKQQQNTASTPNSQSWQSKKDSVEISQQGQQALRDLNLSGLTQLERDARRDARQRELQQSADEHYLRELTPEQKKEQQLMINLSSSAKLNFDDEFKKLIEYAKNKLGIDFQDMNEIEIGLNGYQMTVSGLKSESDNKKLAEELNRIVSTISPLGTILSGGMTRTHSRIQDMFYRNTDYAMSADDEQERSNRATLIMLKDQADKYTKECGIDLDFSQLYRTEDGKIAGYPEETAWYFESELTTPTNFDQAAKGQRAFMIRYYANKFLDAGYDNIPNANELNVVFKFNQGSFVDLNASA